MSVKSRTLLNDKACAILRASWERSMSIIKYCRTLMPVLMLTAVLSVPASAASVKKAKPQLPIQVTIVASQPGVTPENIKPGDVVDLVVSAVSFVDTDAMTLNVAIPDSAALLSGDLSWTGPATKGEKKTMLITVRVPQKGAGEIKAQASISIANSNTFTASSQYALGGSKKTKPQKKGPVKKDSKGGDVIEYR
jgi:hypothetical protein